MPNLNQITLRSGMYLGFRYGFGTLISLANMLVLTWWIGPRAYGLFVTVIGLSGFLASLARTGADTYLVRMERPPDQKLYHLAMTLIGANAIALLAIGVMIIPLLVRWFGNCEFVAPYLASLLTIPLTGLAGPPTAKLERGLEFGKVAGIELAGQFLALIVSILLAWRHMGVWAPVAGLLAWQVWAMAAALHAASVVPRFFFDWQEAKKMLSFGVGYTMSLRAWQLRTLVNPMIVGRLAGPESVAYVGLAIRIAEGLGFVRIAAGRLAIAALSRLREDSVRMRRALQRALELQVMMLGPLLCGFALAAPIVFSYLIGSRWLSSLTVFPWVAAAILANSVYNLQASAFFVLGEQWTVFRASVFQVFLLALCTWWLLPKFGISGYGCADLIACIAYFDLHATLAKTVSLSYRRLAAWTFSLSAPLFCVLQIHRQFKFLLWAPLLLVVTHELHSRKAGRKRAPKSFENSQTGEILIPASTGD
jgi:O-antigen/teichoic acid export membrane protein